MASRSYSFNSNLSESSSYDDTNNVNEQQQPSNPIPERVDSFNNGLLGFTFGSKKMRKKKPFYQKSVVTVGLILALFVIAPFVLMDWWMISRIQKSGRVTSNDNGVEFRFLEANSSTLSIKEELVRLGKGRKPQKTIYARLLAKAAHALAEGQNKPEPKDLWAEPYFVASSWKPCAEQRDWQPSEGQNGYIMITANGGINQQRVAVRSAMLLRSLDYSMQPWFFPNFCTVVFGEM